MGPKLRRRPLKDCKVRRMVERCGIGPTIQPSNRGRASASIHQDFPQIIITYADKQMFLLPRVCVQKSTTIDRWLQMSFTYHCYIVGGKHIAGRTQKPHLMLPLPQLLTRSKNCNTRNCIYLKVTVLTLRWF